MTELIQPLRDTSLRLLSNWHPADGLPRSANVVGFLTDTRRAGSGPSPRRGRLEV